MDESTISLQIAVVDTNLLAGESTLVYLTFSDIPLGFALNDIQLISSTGASAGILIGFIPIASGGGTYTYQSLFQPSLNFEGTVSMYVPQGSYMLGGIVPGSEANSQTINIDTKIPTATISINDQNLTIGESATVTLKFSESISGLQLSDIDLSGAPGSVSDLVKLDEFTYALTYIPQANLENSNSVISIINESYVDLRGNAGSGGSLAGFAINTLPQDQTPPSPTLILGTALAGKAGMDFNVSFDEAVTGFDADDFFLSEGTIELTATANANAFTFHYSPYLNSLNDGSQVSIQIRAGGYADLQGNAGLASATANFTLDVNSPALTISLPADTALSMNETMLVTFSFTEPVTGFDLNDISLSQAVGAFTDLQSIGNDSYTALFTPDSGTTASDVTISVSGAYTDLAGNAGTGATSAGFSIDSLAPTLSISLSDNSLIRGETTQLTFTFSEAVTGFSAGDVRLDGLAVVLSDFIEVDAGKNFTAIYTPPVDKVDSTNVFSVNAGSYADLFGNSGAAAQSGNFSIDTLGKSLFGTAGSDVIIGTAGADRIGGVPQSGKGAGKGSVDLLTGLGGADVFVLGSKKAAYYDDGNNNSNGSKDFATIIDFNKNQEDKIEVKEGTYFFNALTLGKLSGAGLYLDTNNSNSFDSKDELVGFLVGVAPGSLSTAQDLILL